MKMIRVLSTSFLLSLLTVGICIAEAPAQPAVTKSTPEITVSRDDAIALARSYAQAQRQAVVAVNLQMTSAEATAFWPVYQEYQNALDPVRDRLVKLIIAYSEKFETLTDDDAKAMLEEMLSIQESENKIRRDFLGKFTEVLPMKKVARFYQLDNKMNAEIRYQMSLEIPLLQAE